MFESLRMGFEQHSSNTEGIDSTILLFLSLDSQQVTISFCHAKKRGNGKKNKLFMTKTKWYTFFIWNLMVLFKSLTLSMMSSPWVNKEGNLPALFKPGPKSLGICLIKDSEARKASYFFANFLTSFFCLFNFFKSSALMNGTPFSLASSQCCWSPKTQTENLGLGMWRNLYKKMNSWIQDQMQQNFHQQYSRILASEKQE